MVEKIFRKFTLNLGKGSRKSVEFQKKCRKRLKVKALEL